MSVSGLFEKILGLQVQRHERRLNSYLDMVAAIAKEEEPNPAEVETILDSAGRTVDDLKRDVEKYRHRLELKAKVATLPQVEQELEKIAGQIKAADQQLEEAEARYTDVTAPLYARQRELHDARATAAEANRQLFDTCDDPALRSLLDQVTGEMRQLAEKQRELVSQVSYLRTRADNERHSADRELQAEDREHRLEQAELYEKQAKSLERQIKAHERNQAALLKRREDIENRMRAS